MSTADEIRGAAQRWYDQQLQRAADVHGAHWAANREWVEAFVRTELKLRLIAQLALRGYAVYEIESGFLIARWDRTLHCSNLGQVRAFHARISGAA